MYIFCKYWVSLLLLMLCTANNSIMRWTIFLITGVQQLQGAEQVITWRCSKDEGPPHNISIKCYTLHYIIINDNLIHIWAKRVISHYDNITRNSQFHVKPILFKKQTLCTFTQPWNTKNRESLLCMGIILNHMCWANSYLYYSRVSIPCLKIYFHLCSIDFSPF